MRQFYLLDKNLSEIALAEDYLKSEYNLNPNIGEAILRIITFLSNVTLNNSGMIEQLKPKTTNDGIIYYSFEDDYVIPNTNQHINYEIVKKLVSQNHVYEIRFISENNNTRRNCRILFTINEKKIYLIWTHGFTKLPTSNKDKIKQANILTDQLAQLAELIHTSVVFQNNESYITNKEGKKHEVR